MPKYISIFNNKGGVGKTTLCWNIAHSLGELEKKVLLIDFDPQCNLSISILSQGVFTNLLSNSHNPYGNTLRSFAQNFLQNTGGVTLDTHKGSKTNQNVDLIAGDFWLNIYAEALSVGSDLLTGTGISKYAVIREMVNFIQSTKEIEYDYIIIDLPPSFGPLVRAAYYCSDYYIIPSTSDTYSSYCIGLIAEMFPNFDKDWQQGFARFKQSNPNISKFDNLGVAKFCGLIFNGYDTRSGSYVKADQIHLDNIINSVNTKLISNTGIRKQSGLGNPLIGTIEDMNVLIQNSIWQTAPVPTLRTCRPLKTLQEKGNWASNQLALIDELKIKFNNIANHIIANCI